MRTLLSAALLSLLAATIGACSSTVDSKPHTSSATPPTLATPSASATNTTADAKTYTMQSGGRNILQITGPANLRPKAGDGSLDLDGPQYEVEFWLVPGAQSLDAATNRITPLIADQFKDFKPDHTTSLAVAGAPAKRIHGTGHEADDGDPGEANVIVFKLGNRVFVACHHGEVLTPAGEQALDTLVQTAQNP